MATVADLKGHVNKYHLKLFTELKKCGEMLKKLNYAVKYSISYNVL